MMNVITRLRNLLSRNWPQQTNKPKGGTETVALDGNEFPVDQIDQHDGRVILSVDVASAVDCGNDFSSIWRHKQVDVSMGDREFRANIDMCSVEHGFAAIGLEPIENHFEGLAPSEVVADA